MWMRMCGVPRLLGARRVMRLAGCWARMVCLPIRPVSVITRIVSRIGGTGEPHQEVRKAGWFAF